MKINFTCNKKMMVAAQLIMIILWVSNLVYTDSYFSIYALCAVSAVVCLLDNYKSGRESSGMQIFLGLTLACLLSLAVTLANYPIFQRLRYSDPSAAISDATNAFLNYMDAGITYLSGISVFYQIFRWFALRFPTVLPAEQKLPTGKYPGRIFAAVFASLSAIYLVYLFFVVYPGSVTSDSIWQISQIVHNAHTNHHPYWHTMSIQACLALGYALFGTANAGAATYAVVQSLAMAAAFAYAVVTLYQRRIPKVWVFVVYAMFACLPNHISYSATMWKDVPFGITMLVLTVALFRLIRNVGKSKALNWVMFAVGGIGSCIMRSNGWPAMLAAFVMLVLFYYKKCKHLLLPWLGMLIVGWFLIGPALDMLNVANVNFIEGLSVPLQQVSRVIANGGELTEEETALIDTIVDIEEIPELYWPECVDPIKDEIRSKNYGFLRENKGEFLSVWAQIGMRYPWEYVKAWVEQTKGYWNGGYDYYIYAQYVSANDFGIELVRQDNIIHDLVKAYFTFTRETVFFEPLQSIGFNIWILSGVCFLMMLHKRREFLLTMPVLAVVFTLWLTTPVYTEFRYAYSVFTTLPFIVPVSLYRVEDEES